MLYPKTFSQFVSVPVGLSSAIKANASGTPAKFDATPQNVIKLERIKRGNPPRIAEYASRKPKIPPPTEVTRLIWMLIKYALIRAGLRSRFKMFWKVIACVFES